MPDSNSLDLHRDPAALKGTRLRVEEKPSWVSRHKVKNIPRENDSPVTLLLLDRQIFPDEQIRYTRYVRRLETPQAVQEAGKLELEFDPSTQVLLIHAISVYRDGKLTNLVDIDQIQLIQRERNLESGIYAGSLTALFIPKDIRTGDILDIETSTFSDGAIFAGHYWFGENFEHTVPVASQFFSVLSKDHSRYQIQSDLEFECTEEEGDHGTLKTWSQGPSPAIELEPFLPFGLNPFRGLSFSSFETWQQVATEIHSLWADTAQAGEELPRELQTLRQNHPDGGQQLIEALVAFVRDTIRYQGIEVGRLGLVPETLSNIWDRRYGDCKEKTSLLCWLLNSCDFEASPALVSTQLLARVDEELPSPGAFDHVVVHLRYQEKDYWIDPTNISQRGQLENWTSLPFCKALLIDPSTTDFLDIPSPSVGSDKLAVNEHYLFDESSGDATLKVEHRYHGSEADGVRNVLDSQGRVAVQKILTEIVQTTRPKAELSEDVAIEDNAADNCLILRGTYQVPQLLNSKDPNEPAVCEFAPHSIVGKIAFVDKKERQQPIGLPFPLEVEHETRVTHSEAKGSKLAATKIDNEYLFYESSSHAKGDDPIFRYHYYTKAAEIPAAHLNRYLTNLDQIGESISLFFQAFGKKTAARRQHHRQSASRQTRSKSSGNHWLWVFVIFAFVLVRIVSSVLRENRPPPPPPPQMPSSEEILLKYGPRPQEQRDDTFPLRVDELQDSTLTPNRGSDQLGLESDPLDYLSPTISD